MVPNKNPVHVRQTGLGLVEILVGLAIGLITTLVIVQVVATFEGQKRSTNSGADAQTNGSIALYSIQRQAQMAGFGLPIYTSQHQPLNCATSKFDHDGDPATPMLDISPVTIVDGGAGAGASDTIIVRSGPTLMGGVPITVSNVIGNVVYVTNNLSCAKDDIAFVNNGATCVMTKVTDIPLPAVSTTQITMLSAAGIAVGGTLGCMGGWTETLYQVTSNNLMENSAPIVTGIVNIQAQYGVAAKPDDNQVTAWVDASGATWGPAMAVVDRNRIKAIRVAVVARSGLFEKEEVTSACSSLNSAAPTGLCAWEGTVANPAPAIDLSKNADGTANPDWRHYRYRVFEMIVSMRNMIWSKGAL